MPATHHPMRLEDIAPGQSLDGIIPGTPVDVLAVQEMGPGAVGVVYRDVRGVLGERLVHRVHEPGIHVPMRRRAWAMDAEGGAFLRAIDGCREAWRHDGAGEGAVEALMCVRRGAFLVDLAWGGLGPRLLLVMGWPRGEGGDPPLGAGLSLVEGTPKGEWRFAREDAHRALHPVPSEDWPLLHELLRPLVADVALRRRALAWVAGLRGAGWDEEAWQEGGGRPWQRPPLLLGGAIVVPAGLVPWLRQADAGSGGNLGTGEGTPGIVAHQKTLSPRPRRSQDSAPE